MSKPPPGDVRLEPQVRDGTRPVCSRFEVVREFRHHFVRRLRMECFQALADEPMEFCPAAGCEAFIEHLAVQRMYEFEVLGKGSVGKMSNARSSHDLVSARQILAHLFKHLMIQFRCRCDDRCRERTAYDARQLHNTLLNAGESLELRLDHPPQVIGHRKVDLRQWNLQLPTTVPARDQSSRCHVIQGSHHEEGIAFRMPVQKGG
jgi:hypothetical protein